MGHEGWLPGGSAFASYTVSPDVKLGFALAGNVGGVLNYTNDWVGRYYVQQTWIIGMSLLPTVAWKVSDKLSLGASLNAMYGIYKTNVAINNVDPLFGDGRLKLKDETWGWGANLGLLYEFSPATRFGLTWSSQVNLNFLQIGGDYPFLNCIKNAQRWGYLDNSGLPEPSELDSDGYPIKISHSGVYTVRPSIRV